MKTFKITYNHNIYKPSNYDIFKQQQDWILTLEAEDIEQAKEILKKSHNKNPAYFSIVEIINNSVV